MKAFVNEKYDPNTFVLSDTAPVGSETLGTSFHTNK
jgi:hypothetical protein